MTIIFGRKLVVGDWVEWYSAAGGYWQTKQGQIVAVIPPEMPFYQWQEQSGFDVSMYSLRSDLGCGARREASFLVAVAAPSGRGKPRLYWPQAQRLQKIAPPHKETNNDHQRMA